MSKTKSKDPLQIFTDEESQIYDYVVGQISDRRNQDTRVNDLGVLKESIECAVGERYGTEYRELVPEYFKQALELIEQEKFKGKNLEKLSLEVKAVKNIGTKIAKGTYETGKFIFESYFKVPTRWIKNYNYFQGSKGDECDAFAYSVIPPFSLWLFSGDYLEKIDSLEFMAIPLATNIASGLYELYRHEKKKLKTESIEK